MLATKHPLHAKREVDTVFLMRSYQPLCDLMEEQGRGPHLWAEWLAKKREQRQRLPQNPKDP